jgi:diguanylate cyclase (GGDEF)-like protein/PAS domain S-box-containing protein
MSDPAAPRPRRGRRASRFLTAALVGVLLACVLWTARLGSTPVLPSLSAWIGGTLAALAVGLSLYQRHQQARDLLLEALAQADTTLQAVNDGVITLDGRHRVRFMNPSAERLSGIDLDAALGRPVHEVLGLAPTERHRFEQTLDQCLRTGAVVQMNRSLPIGPHGSTRHVQCSASPVLTGLTGAGHADTPAGDSTASSIVITLTDLTDSLLGAGRLQHEATHDPLTGLPNRALLADRFQHAIAGAQRDGSQVGLLFIDIDRFKRINDSLGHHHGDAVLQAIAQRLQAGCAPHDTVARWGGDEFVVLLEPAVNREVAAARAAQLIAAVAAEIQIDGVEVACGCSVGIVLAPQDGSYGDALIAMADAAMDRAKARGGMRFELHAAEIPGWTRAGLALETRLRHGLEDHCFELHYQPQVHVASGRAVGLEALLRWRQPDGELWSPSRFLAVTEETGLILAIGEWVVREAVAQIARWRDLGLPLLPVSVNVSARQCLDRSLVHIVAGALADNAVPAALLKIEITESAAMADLGQLHGLLTDLRALGVGVAMDDFGTGYSSLAHLRRFPVDQIKIDPSFISDITQDPNGAAIVRATIALAHSLGLPVVAEGVESDEQMRFLTLHGCDIVQGYLHAMPQSASDLASYLRRSADATPA